MLFPTYSGCTRTALKKLPLGLSYPNKLCFFSLMDKRVEPKLKKLNPPKQKLQLHFHHARASSLPFPPNTEFICYQNATPHTWTIEQPSGLFLWSYDPPFLESPKRLLHNVWVVLQLVLRFFCLFAEEHAVDGARHVFLAWRSAGPPWKPSPPASPTRLPGTTRRIISLIGVQYSNPVLPKSVRCENMLEVWRPWCWLPTPNLQHIGWFYQIELGYYMVLPC